jgi:hypothetical protein
MDTPTAVATVQCVEYADGSIWGECSRLAEISQTRRTSLQELLQLRAAYVSGGADAFRKALHDAPKLSVLADLGEEKNESLVYDLS